MKEERGRSRWIAIITGAISVAIGVLYLAMITVLDARGPMLPPPPEALAGVEASPPPTAEAVQPLAASHWPEIASGRVPAG